MVRFFSLLVFVTSGSITVTHAFEDKLKFDVDDVLLDIFPEITECHKFITLSHISLCDTKY